METKVIDLLSYWLPTLRQLQHFKEIAKSEEPELRLMLERLYQAFLNTFILSADETGIKHFEDMLKITPPLNATLETRRNNVYIKWRDNTPPTKWWILYYTLPLIDPKVITNSYYNEYALDIEIHLPDAGTFDVVCNLLQDIMPCNIVWTILNKLEAKSSTKLYLGAVINTAIKYLITQDFSKDYSISSDEYNAVVVNTAMQQTITQDIDAKYNISSDNYEGAVINTSSNTVITQDIDTKANITANTKEAAEINTAVIYQIKE